jgi:predicted small metal-binding protein
MMKQLFTALFAVTLIFAFSTVTFGQDKEAAKAKSEMKMEMKKKEMKKEQEMKEGAMSGLKSLSCDPACGFKVVSKDEAEIISMTKEHVKAHHPDMTMSDAQIKEMVKPAGGMMHEKMMDKKMDKKMDEKKPDGL